MALLCDFTLAVMWDFWAKKITKRFATKSTLTWLYFSFMKDRIK